MLSTTALLRRRNIYLLFVTHPPKHKPCSQALACKVGGPPFGPRNALNLKLNRPVPRQAAKPDDWEDDEDGEWEPATIKNPEFKGAWKPKMIPNPDYKGPWEHPMVANPEYKADDKLSQRCTACTHIGFELWQVRGMRRRVRTVRRTRALLLLLVVMLFFAHGVVVLFLYPEPGK